jgi:hypothetical protein
VVNDHMTVRFSDGMGPARSSATKVDSQLFHRVKVYLSNSLPSQAQDGCDPIQAAADLNRIETRDIDGMPMLRQDLSDLETAKRRIGEA